MIHFFKALRRTVLCGLLTPGIVLAMEPEPSTSYEEHRIIKAVARIEPGPQRSGVRSSFVDNARVKTVGFGTPLRSAQDVPNVDISALELPKNDKIPSDLAISPQQTPPRKKHFWKSITNRISGVLARNETDSRPNPKEESEEKEIKNETPPSPQEEATENQIAPSPPKKSNVFIACFEFLMD